MKLKFLMAALFAFLTFTIPMIGLTYGADNLALQTAGPLPSPQSSASLPPNDASGPQPSSDAEEQNFADEEIDFESISEFKIYDQSTHEVHTVALQDYVRGALAAEMPASFHIEAMKAQAVSAHTYALKLALLQRENPDPALNGADFSADPGNWKGYILEDQAKVRFGGNFDLYWNRICKAADSVLSEILIYDGQPIIAAYHSMSSGATEDAANVWNASVPYLTPVDSQGDLLAPNYQTEVVLSSVEVENLLLNAYPDLILSDHPEDWFSNINRSDSGYIISCEVGNTLLEGQEIRNLFGLRSSNMDIGFSQPNFTFTVRGYGHGVGLSQYGADYMARQGATYDEILAHYYSGAQLYSLPD